MNKRFRVLHYKSGIDGKVVDNAIGFWTKVINLWDWKTWFLPWYSHSEIWVPHPWALPSAHGGNFVEYDSLLKENVFVGTCYSSTMGQIREKETRFAISGTRKLPASEVLKHPERWDYTEFEVPDKVSANGMRLMEFLVITNKGYAKRDISKFFPIVRHFVKQDALRYICSEFGHKVCVVFKVLKGPGKVISPLRLARKMPWIKDLVTGKLLKGF